MEDPVTGMAETMGYIEMEGDQLYFVQHHAARTDGPRGAVVVCGPIGAQRERAYRTLVDLSRSLALQGFDVLRFDYRGIGESTGRFERLCMSDWKGDVERCISFVRDRAPGAPLALWGVRAGALLASECFGEGMCEAMMLCAPLAGRAMLQDILRRNLVADMIARRRRRG